MRKLGPAGQAIVKAGGRRVLAAVCDLSAAVINYAAPLAMGLATILALITWAVIVTNPFLFESSVADWALSALAIGALAWWGWRDRANVAERMEPSAPGMFEKGLAACMGVIWLMGWRLEMWGAQAGGRPLDEGQKDPKPPFKPGFPEWPGRPSGHVAGSVSECVEPARANCLWAWGMARQLHLAIPTVLWAGVALVAAFLLWTALAARKLLSSTGRDGELSAVKRAALACFEHLSFAVFFACGALALWPWAADAGESWRWASFALLLATPVGVLWVGSSAPGAFGPGWWKVPVTSSQKAAVWTLNDKIFLQDSLMQETLAALMVQGRTWRALGLAFLGAPASCLRGAGMCGSILWLMASSPLLVVEWALSRAFKAGASVANGSAPTHIKARLADLEREGAADFARAERSELAGLTGAAPGASVKKNAPRL
jgi:hypothetical protein